MNEKEIKTKLKEGWIHLLVTFEIIGKPKEHVQTSLKGYLDTIKKDERIGWIKEHIGKPEKAEGDMFGSYAEVDLIVKDMETATWLAINFTPASIEVIEPLDFKFTGLQVQNWLNDILSRLHTIGASYKSQTSQMDFLKVQLTTLIQNNIILSLSRGPKNTKQIMKDTSVVEETLEPNLRFLIKEKKIKEKDGVYSL